MEPIRPFGKFNVQGKLTVKLEGGGQQVFAHLAEDDDEAEAKVLRSFAKWKEEHPDVIDAS